MTPKKIYYIFGLDEKFSDKEFALYNYLNIKSAHLLNPDYEIEVVFKYNPNNKYFKKLDAFCKKTQIDKIPQEFNNQKILCAEHACGYLRIQYLYNNGGIYLDTDVLCLKSFDDLLDNKCIMGEEYGRLPSKTEDHLIGLCDAVIISPKNNLFLKSWIEDYHNNYQFNSWNYNAVIRPHELSKNFSDDIKVLSSNYFFKYSWNNLGFEKLFNQVSNVNDSYVAHLWASINNHQLQRYNNLNNSVWNEPSTVTNQYKKYLENEM